MKKTFILFLTLFTFLTTYGQTEKEKVEATVTKSDIEGNIYFLADDLLKGRETGTPENKIAAAYLANTLRSYGVKPVGANVMKGNKTENYYQIVQLNKTSPIKQMLLTVDNNEYKQKVVLEGNKMDMKGEAIYLGYGLESDYKGVNVKEKVVLIKAGGPNANDARAAFGLKEEKENLAIKNGAIAVIEFVNTNETIWGFIDHNFNGERLEIAKPDKMENPKGKLVYVWVRDENGLYAKSLENKKTHTIQLAIDGKTKTPILSQNVIGMVEGTDPVLKNEYIIYSAHYDHVGIGQPDATGDVIYNGARDNAVGTTTVLSMAKNLAKYPTKRSALFILFTGEEKGLLGSQYYVENPVLPLKNMVYCFNSDNAGYNDTKVATIVGLGRTTASGHIKEAATAFGIEAIDDPAPEQGLFDRSDNVHFAKAGIPAPTFSLGFRSFDGEVTKYYHQAGDEAQTLDYEYLEKFFKAYVLSGRLIGNDPKTPRWSKGDIYEAAGKKLYGN